MIPWECNCKKKFHWPKIWRNLVELQQPFSGRRKLRKYAEPYTKLKLIISAFRKI